MTLFSPARFVMDPFKPTFLKRDANSFCGSQASRPKAGSWKR